MEIIDRIKKHYKKRKNQKFIISEEDSMELSQFDLDLRKPMTGKKYIKIGKNSTVNINACFETESGEIIIGNHVYCGQARIISRNKVQIDDNVMMSWGILLYDHNSHSFDYKERRKDIECVLQNKRNGINEGEGKNWDVVHSAPIHICKDAWIGEGVTILSGVTIGEGAIVGAGSVVRKSIPAWTIAYGNPCKVVADNKIKPIN